VARRLVVQQVHDHQGDHGQGTIPLLAIDAWEHAYYLQYQNDKAKFSEKHFKFVPPPGVKVVKPEAASPPTK